MDDLTLAKMIATLRHSGDFYGVLPYTHHLQDVEYVLRRFDTDNKTNPDLFVAAWLHDIVEDTRMKRRDLEEKFGDSVTVLVMAVTDVDGPNRAASKAMTYPKIRAAGKDAVRLKLADRIANMENRGRSFAMYQREHEDFRRSLYTKGENEDMWVFLDDLAKGKI